MYISGRTQEPIAPYRTVRETNKIYMPPDMFADLAAQVLSGSNQHEMGCIARLWIQLNVPPETGQGAVLPSREPLEIVVDFELV